MACNGVELFATECLDNLIIKLTPNFGSDGTTECFSEAYPDLSLTDLIVSAAGSNDAAEDVCAASLDGSDGNFFYGNQDLNAAVSTGAFYFLASKCGTEHEETDVGGTNYMQFKTTLMSSFTATANSVMTHQEMLETEIICNYKMNIDNIMVSIDTELDAVNDDDKIDEDDVPQELSSGVVTHTTTVDDVIYTVGDVILGADVAITFNAVGEITSGFYIDSCTASNNDESVTTELVINGCPNQVSSEPIASINPSVTGGVTLGYEQFAYVASNSDAGNPTLEFNLSCVLKFGDAPASCAGVNTTRRRRQAREANNEDGAKTTIDIPVTVGENGYTVDSDGVMTIKTGEDNNSGATEMMVSAFAASAFLLL